jgi:hypothetical protein
MNSEAESGDRPGIGLEKMVARIQQMFDPNSTVTHNEWLVDRIGNRRQFDVVIRGTVWGRGALGVVECKDHSVKSGPAEVEAFAKKCENVGANIRLMVSKKGFTEQALKLATHEGIGCLSLLPQDPKQVGFGIGSTWFGVIRKWTNVRLEVHFAAEKPPITNFASESVKWQGKPVAHWFQQKLLTTHEGHTKEGDFRLGGDFQQVRNLEIEGKEYPVKGLTCFATWVFKKKKKWVTWSGDAFYDWNENKIIIPPGGKLVGTPMEFDLSAWGDYEGEIPDLAKGKAEGFIPGVLYDYQKWDETIEVQTSQNCKRRGFVRPNGRPAICCADVRLSQK